MSKLTRSQIAKASADAQVDFCLDKQPTYEVALARRIEAAATEPLLQRIEELEKMNTQLREQNTEVDKACAELERQLEEARKDAKRLDWMIFYSASLNHGNDGEYCRVVWRDHEFGEQATRLFGDSREAIDAAMQKGQS